MKVKTSNWLFGIMMIIIIGISILVNSPVYGQKITYYQNVMTDKNYLSFMDSNDKGACLVSEDGTTGFILGIYFNEDGSTKQPTTATPVYITATLAMEGVGCVEGGVLIFLFTDGTKIKINNWAKFNCDGSFLFTPTKSEWATLYQKHIDKIMIQDGRSMKSYTNKPENSNYFIELGRSVKTSLIKTDPPTE